MECRTVSHQMSRQITGSVALIPLNEPTEHKGLIDDCGKHPAPQPYWPTFSETRRMVGFHWIPAFLLLSRFR
jgi:hypothetical protein